MLILLKCIYFNVLLVYTNNVDLWNNWYDLLSGIMVEKGWIHQSSTYPGSRATVNTWPTSKDPNRKEFDLTFILLLVVLTVRHIELRVVIFIQQGLIFHPVVIGEGPNHPYISFKHMCPIIWHFCGKISSNIIEKIQEKASRFMLKDQISTYEQLLEKCNYATLHILIKTFTNNLNWSV